jgi:hypothetical protein
MFVASPGLHAVEHPVYDVWLVDCKVEMGEPERQEEPEADGPLVDTPVLPPPDAVPED